LTDSYGFILRKYFGRNIIFYDKLIFSVKILVTSKKNSRKKSRTFVGAVAPKFFTPNFCLRQKLILRQKTHFLRQKHFYTPKTFFYAKNIFLRQ